MALLEELESQGHFLFRWRSYIPALIVLLSVVYIKDYKYVGGTYQTHLFYLFFCFFISLLGVFVRSITIAYTPKHTSGRNTKEQVAETVNRTGIYSVLRHPLYVGNFLIFLGIVLLANSISFSLIFVLFYFYYYERIIFTEEQFMRRKFGDTYKNWADQTPIMLPRFSNYQKPALPFSFRNILKREYPTLAGSIVAFIIYDYCIVYLNELSVHSGDLLKVIKPIHIYSFTFAFVFYVLIRVIVKTTKLLEVEGR
jgi:lipid A Kdo2 1-phosphate O-methyltransferase